MFFGNNKNLEEKILLLDKEIADLKNQLLLKDKEKEEIEESFSKQLEDLSKQNEKKLEVFR